MQLVLNEDQELLAKTASDFARERSPVARMRALRDAGDPLGFSRELWKEMGELGWLGIPFPEAYGGADMGVADLAVVLEALGRQLAPEPVVSSLLLGGQVLLRGGSDAQREAWLPGLIEGDRVVAVAHQERTSRYDVARVEARAERSGDGWTLRGEKLHALDAAAADALLVSARHDGDVGDAAGVSVFLVPADRAGLALEAQHRVDSRGSAIVRLDGVAVGDADRVGEAGQGVALVADAVEVATAGLCAEMLGGMEEAFRLTLEYLKERVQFDVPIGSFQALKHRAARCFMEIELCRSAVMAAARAVDADGPGSDEARKLVSLAKARCSDAYIQVANEGVQMFGGVGMTDEYDIGLYLKRARAAELTFGDAAFHRDRWARLSGY